MQRTYLQIFGHSSLEPKCLQDASLSHCLLLCNCSMQYTILAGMGYGVLPNNSNNYYYYLLQLGRHPMAVVILHVNKT